MSKRLPILPPSRPDDFDADGAPALWRSVEGREQSPEVREAQQREFPPGASELKDAVSRRSLLKFATLSTAIASLEGCANPAEPIMPFTRRPEDLVPGNPLHFATAMPFEGYGSGLLAVSNEGRPTKLEGNPEHPTSLGATSVFGQAAVLQLYDRARARGIVGEGRPQGWRAFLTSLVRRMDAARAQDGGARVRFLMEPSSSPLQQHLRSRIQQVLPNARFYSWSPVNHDAPRAGARVAFGRPLDAHYQFENADVVVSLDSDFLECTPDHLRHARAFTARRDPDAGPMNRLYAFEANLTTTGAFADHRFRAKSAEIQAVATALLARVAQAVPAAADASPGAPQLPEHLARAVEVIAKDLVANRGRSLIIAGERQPPAVHAVAHALNSALGNVGPTVRYAAPVTIDAEDGSAVLRRLVEEINAGQVDTLLITAMNPVYAAPVDLEFAAALAKVPNSIYLGLYNDETAARTTWFLPSAHFLESWGDTRAVDGTVTLIQPLLQPLFGGATEVDVLSAFLGEAEKGTWAQLREYWSARVNRPDFDFWWDQALQRGFIEGTTVQFETPAADFGAVRGALAQARAVSTEGIEINFVPDYKVWDGRFASLGWLQELPHPITKVVWDNAVLLSPATAARLNVRTKATGATSDLVTITYRGHTLTGPAFVVPGHADDAITVALGYGRTVGAGVGEAVGFNAYALRHSDAPWFDGGAQLEKAGGTFKLAQTQEHWSMEDRQPAMMTTVAKLPETKHTLDEMRAAKMPTLQEPVEYDGLKWGMSVDLSKCTGCSACVVACQSENNIPVVGKDLVANTREMHWLRIDRYFAGDLHDPQVVMQPLMCVHCEAAPCEYVCPVNATVHSDEGLNDMAYNRCVGTRYCSNNCPYKVRRFNYFSYINDRGPLEKMLMNPDVTVRSRGVMEKCTYCVQRIERWRIAERTGTKQYYGRLQTACQQACPTRAIEFGNLNDKGSEIARLHASDRRYDLLYFLGTRPRTAYLARVKNPNPELA